MNSEVFQAASPTTSAAATTQPPLLLPSTRPAPPIQAAASSPLSPGSNRPPPTRHYPHRLLGARPKAAAAVTLWAVSNRAAAAASLRRPPRTRLIGAVWTSHRPHLCQDSNSSTNVSAQTSTSTRAARRFSATSGITPSRPWRDVSTDGDQVPRQRWLWSIRPMCPWTGLACCRDRRE